MPEGIWFIPLPVIGLAAIIWGLPASHTLPHPRDIGAAAAVLAGVALTIVGLLLTFVPGFFR
ncbi:MAG TPA: hypothetical protein PLN25_07230 [Deltaproteobacteria bacterium]|nr:hypothetical protein [Deltaproteobacteria bacterium]HQB37698.1 hypothetical protein [Deltaproteobacteria bacterium]